MGKQSAGILMFRRTADVVEVFLVHPGGPFWAGKDLASWSIPKGEFGPDEDPLDAAKREFQEETSCQTVGTLTPLGSLKQPSGKVIHAWAMEGNIDASAVHSNTFTMEWPPKSGKMQTFPEIDRAAWFDADTARAKLHKGLIPFIDKLLSWLGVESRPSQTDGQPRQSATQQELF